MGSGVRDYPGAQKSPRLLKLPSPFKVGRYIETHEMDSDSCRLRYARRENSAPNLYPHQVISRGERKQ